MVENIYNNLFQRGLVTQSFEEFNNGFINDPNFKQRILNDFPELTVSQPNQNQEQNTISEDVDWFGQTWFGRGFRAASTTGEATNLMSEDFSNISKESIEGFVRAKENEAKEYVPSPAMEKFTKQYVEEGSTWAAWFRGVKKQPNLLPELLVQSFGTQVGTLIDSPKGSVTAMLGGAATGAKLAGKPGAIAGALGGLATSMEAALTFGELIETELQKEGKEFTDTNIKELLEGPKGTSIRNKSIGRGLTIGAVEGLTGGIAGKTALAARGVVRGAKTGVLAAGAAGTAVEAVGGGLGEIGGRLVAGQEMDAAEIGFEAITGTVTAPINVGAALATAKPPTYTLNGETITYDKMKNFIDTAEDIDVAKANIKMKNDFTGIGKKAQAKQEAAIKTIQQSGDKTKIEEVAKATRDNLISETVAFAEEGKKIGKDVLVVDNDIRAQAAYDNIAKKFDLKARDVTGADGFIVGDSIVINKDVAGKTGQINVGGHEILHGILNKHYQSLSTQQQKDFISGFLNTISTESKTYVENILKERSDIKPQDLETTQEWLTVYSDGIVKGEITFNESLAVKLRNFLQEIFRKFGYNKEFVTGLDTYNFMRDYQKSITEGKLRQRAIDVAGGATKAELAFSKQASDDVQNIYNQQGEAGAFDIINLFKPIVSKIVDKRREAPNFDRQLLTDEIETGQRGILDLIKEYKPESGVPLAAYINKFLPARAIEASRRVLGEEFTTDITEARGVAAEEVAAPEVKTKPKSRKIKPIDLVSDPKLKEKYTKNVQEKLKDVDASKLTFKNLKDLSANNTAEIFGVAVKKVTDPAANLTKQEKENALIFIRKNALDLISLLPEGAITEAASESLLGTSTGVPKSLLNKFYTKQDRITKGAGLSPYTKNRNISKADFLKAFGIVEGKKSTDFGPRTPEAQAVKAMMSLYGKLATNSIVRDQLRKQGELQSVIEDIAAGKSELQFSKGSAYTGVTNKQLLDSFKKKNKSLKYYRVNDDIYDEKTGQTNLEKYADDMANIAIEFENKYGPGLFNLSMISNRKGLGGISREQRAKIQKIIIEKVPNVGKRSKKDIYSKKKVDTKFLKTATKKQIKDLNKKNMMLHKEFWMTIRDIVSKDKSSLMSILNMLDISQSEGSHIQRLGAEYLGGHKDVNKIQHLEHALQNANTYRLLLDAAVNQSKDNFIKTYKATVKNYKIIGLPNADNNLLNETDFKNKMSLDESWNVFENSWWQRYFNQTVGDAGGINPVDLMTLDGKTFAEEFGVDIYGGKSNLSIEQAKNKVKIKYPKVLQFSKARRNNKILNDLNDYDTALRNARNLNAPVKGISIFDFDDTLATTKSKIIVNMLDGKVKKITPADFAKQHSKLEEQGATFDFNEFSKVVDGKPALASKKLEKAIKKFGNKDVYVLTARPQQSAQAIYEFLKGVGLEIPLKNITGLENGTPQAKANWVVSKAAEGYNDFYFTDDVYKNVKAVQDALEILDVKSKSRIAYVDRVSKLDKDFNDIIEAKTGIGAEKVYSIAKAKAVGSSKGRFTFFIPPSAEDFVGLLYNTLSKGKLGDNQMAWYKKNLLDPYATAMGNISRERIAVMNDYKQLKKQLSVVPKNLSKVITGDVYTNEQAVRVYIWNKQGMDIPGLSKADLKSLTDYVEGKPQFKTLGDQLISIQKGDEYNAPNSGWLAGTITTDLQAGLGGTKRAKHLAEWQQNVDIIFSEKNLNKMEAAFGKAHRTAMDSILERMKTGINRSFTSDGLTGRVTDWLTNSIGTIMFFNTRSALLQTISAVNFINFKDNNIFAAGKAFANQPQYWSDFMTLMNSDFLVDRRRGLRINVNEADIANMAQESGPRGVISKILQLGFLPTQIADSFAIASGGASFYRNRIKKLVKGGMDQKAAETQAMKDFREIAEESQQSSRPDRISMQQAGPLGRIILAFGNTPMQYARLIKKAASDLVNRRGDWKTNTSKLIYYSTVQNLIFNALQQAIFAIAFGDAEEEDEKKKYLSIANGMADSLLRGVGIAGAFVSVGKNAIIRIINESQKKNPKFEKISYELTKISPPISSKLSKINQAARSYQWEKEEMMKKGFALDNPAWLAAGNVISATTNIPLDRLVKKTNNVVNATSDDLETWERLALLGGWQDWEIGVDDNKDKKKKKQGIKLY